MSEYWSVTEWDGYPDEYGEWGPFDTEAAAEAWVAEQKRQNPKRSFSGAWHMLDPATSHRNAGPEWTRDKGDAQDRR